MWIFIQYLFSEGSEEQDLLTLLFDSLPVQRLDLETRDGWMAHISIGLKYPVWNELWTGVGIMPPQRWASNTCGSYNLGSIISLIGCNCSCKPWTPLRRVAKLTSHCGHFKARPVSFPRGRARPLHSLQAQTKGIPGVRWYTGNFSGYFLSPLFRGFGASFHLKGDGVMFKKKLEK